MNIILPCIDPKIKQILAQGVLDGMTKGKDEVSTNKIYDVGIGCDNKQRYINVQVNHALQTAIWAAKEPALSVETVKHSTGHSLKIHYGRFIIYPKRVDSKYFEREAEPEYHKRLRLKNPTQQIELFGKDDPDSDVFVQLLFGQNKESFFSFLKIPDSYSGGIYELEELKLQQAETLAPEEKVRTPRKMNIRSEKVSGQ
jgi:hypothetical protein